MGAFMCANFVAVVLLSWMPKFLYDSFHMGLAMAGLTATVFVQLASMVGAPLGGWLADAWRRRSPRGRLAVQMVGVLGGAPFVVLCGMTQSIGWLIVALTLWGLFKGLYDANIFASVFDVVRPEARGAAAGFMNTIGWLGGGGTAPLVIGLLAETRPRHRDRAGVDGLSRRGPAAADRDRVLRHARRRADAAGAGGRVGRSASVQACLRWRAVQPRSRSAGLQACLRRRAVGSDRRSAGLQACLAGATFAAT